MQKAAPEGAVFLVDRGEESAERGECLFESLPSLGVGGGTQHLDTYEIEEQEAFAGIAERLGADERGKQGAFAGRAQWVRAGEREK